jgi:hypothetical protein
MSSGEQFVPDLRQEKERLVVVEHALGEGGLIDNHLRWKDRGVTPSAELNDRQYGYFPQRFDTCQDAPRADQRPSREPVDFQYLATEVLGEPYDADYRHLVERIIAVDSGWYDYLLENGVLNSRQARAMRDAGDRAYRLDAQTEDNLPAYTSTILGGFVALATRHGLGIPATEEWARGIWTAEEDGHKLSMNEYGKITGITATPLHTAGRTSQLRSGMEIKNRHTIQLYAYVDWQEQSARLAHDRNADLFGPVGYALQERIGQDESRHHYLYHAIIRALYDHADGCFRDDVIQTLRSVLMEPAMPGSKGIPNYDITSAKIHNSGIFGLEHVHQAARMILKKLNLLDEDATPAGLSDAAHAALGELRAKYGPELPEIRRRHGRFVLGQTVTGRQLAAARRDYAERIGLPARAS